MCVYININIHYIIIYNNIHIIFPHQPVKRVMSRSFSIMEYGNAGT